MNFWKSVHYVVIIFAPRNSKEVSCKGYLLSIINVKNTNKNTNIHSSCCNGINVVMVLILDFFAVSENNKS